MKLWLLFSMLAIGCVSSPPVSQPPPVIDKTIFEAAASGCLSLSQSEDMKEFGFADMTYDSGDSASLALHLERLLMLGDAERNASKARLSALAQEHTLSMLAKRLVAEMSAGE